MNASKCLAIIFKLTQILWSDSLSIITIITIYSTVHTSILILYATLMLHHMDSEPLYNKLILFRGWVSYKGQLN